MKYHISVDFSPEKIRSRRGLGSSHRARICLAQSVRSRCDKYVPFDTGNLKNSAEIAPDGSKLTYSAPYARAQYYGMYHHSDPNRGRFWEKRMLAGESGGLIADVKTVTGGR